MSTHDHFKIRREDRVRAMEAYVEYGYWHDMAEAMTFFGRWVDSGLDDDANDWLLWRVTYEVGRREAIEERDEASGASAKAAVDEEAQELLAMGSPNDA